MINIFLSAGGTGGHMFPAEALARELLARGHSVHLITDSRGKAFGDALPEITVHRVSASTLTGGLVTKIKAVLALIKGSREAMALIKQHQPKAVVAFGGYPSFPGAVAAILTRTPLVLHDQNAVLGRANRVVAHFAKVIAKSFDNVIGLPKSRMAVLTGNPIRPAIAALREQPYPVPANGNSIHLLVTGGSQGARVFSTVVPAAIGQLDAGLRSRLAISQQVRAEDMDSVQQAYKELGMSAQVELQSFFTDMPARIARAHLCIGRAGGSTVAEWTAAGRPAIYVPLPIAILDEQTWNAAAVEKAGGAWVLQQPEFTPANLASLLKRILSDPESLSVAAKAAYTQGRTDAAARLADLVLKVAA
jgi:UDP-N-acetylglucosamine--N-acetylmuramyl-(pentapeptide) pyrophosphoryl-undecaprenol N-acetylglucosamine transferase